MSEDPVGGGYATGFTKQVKPCSFEGHNSNSTSEANLENEEWQHKLLSTALPMTQMALPMTQAVLCMT